MGFKETYQKKKIERDQFIAVLDPKSFDFQLATWFGSGLIIPAPGTWGTIGGMIFGIPLLLLTNSLVVFIVALILFFVGLKSVERLEKKLSDHDPSFIVIDEVAAILLCLSFIGTGNLLLTTPLIFLLFRFFDAKKPWLIGLADRKIQGAWGVMIDDIVAAVFALVTLWLILIIRVIAVWPILGGF
jgi:phosphatidylglycerophosphatase A